MFDTLQSSRITIRPFRPVDAAAFYDAAIGSVNTVGRWLPWCHSGFSLDDAKVWIAECGRNIEAGVAYDLGIFTPDSNILIGGIGINQINKHYNFGNIGYWIRESDQNKGFATEAVRLIVQYGFQQLKLTRLEIAVIEDNIVSRRVAEAVGARLEGIAYNRLLKDGRTHDAAIYSLIPEQYI